MSPVLGSGVIHIGFFSCTDTTIHFKNDTSVQHFEQDDASARVQHLFSGCSVWFILVYNSIDQNLV